MPRKQSVIMTALDRKGARDALKEEIKAAKDKLKELKLDVKAAERDLKFRNDEVTKAEKELLGLTTRLGELK